MFPLSASPIPIPAAITLNVPQKKESPIPDIGPIRPTFTLLIEDVSKVSDFEFSSSVKSITDSLKTYNDSQASLDTWYSLKAYNKELYSPEDIAEKLSFVTREDVIKAANGVKLHTVYKLLPEVKK